MDGGASHIDTFDPKPKLRELHLKEFLKERNKFVSAMESGKRYYVASPFNFVRAKNGMEICDRLPRLAECVDDICFYRGAQAESVNHPTALYHLNTGNMFGTELAFRMQMEVPEIVSIEKEPEAVKRLYGIGEKDSDAFGRRCLLARRLVEKGVRFVQVYSSGWDSHDDIATAHANRMRAIDAPIAGLLQDLKRSGLLESTLVVWAGEFGRSPDNGVRRDGAAYGRDHNPKAMTIWFAGGDVKPGVVGATDEIGAQAIEVVHPLRDVHVTLLRLLGLDDDRLRYFHNGRQMQLSQFGGQVINQILRTT